MASPQPNDDPRLSSYSKEEDSSTRDKSPARLATDAAMAEKKAASDGSGPSPVEPAAAAAAPTDNPAALDPSAAGAPSGAPLEKQPSKEALERSLLKTATLMFALCVSARCAHD
jgi:hypothetical protein